MPRVSMGLPGAPTNRVSQRPAPQLMWVRPGRMVLLAPSGIRNAISGRRERSSQPLSMAVRPSRSGG